MNRILLFFVLCVSIIAVSCQPEPRETLVEREEDDSTVTAMDSTLVHYAVEVFDNNGTPDTGVIYGYRYDAQKRMIAMTDSGTVSVLAGSYLALLDFRYHGDDPWPWLTVRRVYDYTSQDQDLDSVFYTYANNMVATDSTRFYNRTTGELRYIMTRTFTPGPGTVGYKLRLQQYTPDPQDQTVEQVCTIQYVNGNITSFRARRASMDNAYFECAYNTHPDPFYRCSPPYPYPEVVQAYGMNSQKNLATAYSTAVTGGPGGDQVDWVNTYTYRADGYPLTFLSTNDQGDEYEQHNIYY